MRILSEFETGGGGVGDEHFHGVERHGGEVGADQLGGLGEDGVRDRDDRATGLPGLEQVEDLFGGSPGAPEQFRFGQLREQRSAGAHDRHRINTGVGDTAGEHRDDSGHSRVERLGEGEESGDVELHALEAEHFYEREAGLALEVDQQGLALLVGDVVGENFEGNGLGGDGLEDVFGERLLIRDAGPLHEAEVSREALEVGLGLEFEDSGFGGAVSVELDHENVEGFSGGSEGINLEGQGEVSGGGAGRVPVLRRRCPSGPEGAGPAENADGVVANDEAERDSLELFYGGPADLVGSGAELVQVGKDMPRMRRR